MDSQTDLPATGGERSIRAAKRIITLLEELAAINPEDNLTPEVIKKAIEVTDKHRKLITSSDENAADWVALTKTIDIFNQGLAVSALQDIINGLRDAARY